MSKAITLVRSGGFDDDAVWAPMGDRIAVQGSTPDGLYLISYPAGDISLVQCLASDQSACSGETPTWASDCFRGQRDHPAGQPYRWNS